MPSSNKYSIPGGDNGVRSEVKTSSKPQQNDEQKVKSLFRVRKGNSGGSLVRQTTQPSSHFSRPFSRKPSEIMPKRDMRREIDRVVILEKETSSSVMKRNEVLNSRKDEPKSIVLILPKHSPKTNCADIVCNSEHILATDGMSKKTCEETLSAEVSSEKGHFEPLNVVSCSSETPTVFSKYIESFTPKSVSLRGNEIDSSKTFASPSRRFSFGFGKISRNLSFKENSAGPVKSLTPAVVKSETSHRLSSNESVNKALKKQTSEDTIGPTELDGLQNRFSSPNRRFGFSLSKMKRSFSSKEGSNTPQPSPLRAQVSDHSVFPKENKDNLRSKSRSSPLRRLLDPIFKTKVTNPCPTAETPKKNPILCSEKESFDNTKPKQSSMVQALLQTTTKNGLPLFKLVVNNSCDILVAIKNITPSGKQNFDSIYTFYSVHEIKKKSSSWINQVHKEKNYGFGYNVVGQMKGFVNFLNESSVDKFEDRFTEKEFVLCSVERKQGDGEAPELVPIRELASTVVKIPYERNIGKELTGKEFFEYLEDEKYLFGRGEAEKFYDTTVILSGADHGLPKIGAPSSLIQRWRSGGSCDCGGWDVGCKIEILTNEERFGKLPESSVSCSVHDHFDLFNQKGAHDSKPIFKLAPFKKGIYSIEFSLSISLLQALSVCIAAISSRQSFDFSELNSDDKLLERV